MENAIQKAIEGGWERADIVPFTYEGIEEGGLFADAFIDSLFWQALGEQQGWVVPPNGQASFYQHRFIDHLASGGDPESFFTELLTK